MGKRSGTWCVRNLAWVLVLASTVRTTPGWAAAMEWVTVGDAGNAADYTGYGAVPYPFRIGRCEVTNHQYAEFLNAVAMSDPRNLYSAQMATSVRGGIARSGSSGSYTYAVKAGQGDQPVNLVGWYDALRFANWLHNGKPTGAQGPATTEDGAYTFSGETSVGPRNPGAKVFLPNENEWYKQVTLDGSGSSDPDGDPLTYSWTWPGGSATGVNPTVTLPLGATTVTLVVNDGQMASPPDSVAITVQDTTPPALVPPEDVAAEQASLDGTAVELGQAVAIDICDADVAIANDAPAVFPLGETIVTWTAADASGNTATATQKVTIVDTTPPEIQSVWATPGTLWAPNHTMVDVAIGAIVTDICDAEPAWKIVSVASNEPANGQGDGNTSPDWEITGDHTLRLRAERSGKSTGRIYTISLYRPPTQAATPPLPPAPSPLPTTRAKAPRSNQREGLRLPTPHASPASLGDLASPRLAVFGFRAG